MRDLYTWQSRLLRLHHDEDTVTGVVLGYGDPLASRNMHRREPMTAWRRSLAQEKKLRQSPVYLPREHDPARSAWRGIASLVADRSDTVQGAEAAAYLRPGILEWIARLVTEGELPRGFLIRARIVGATYGTQQSVIDEMVDDQLAMPVVLLHRQDRTCARQAIAAAEDADLAVRALGDLATDLARAAGAEGRGPDRQHVNSASPRWKTPTAPGSPPWRTPVTRSSAAVDGSATYIASSTVSATVSSHRRGCRLAGPDRHRQEGRSVAQRGPGRQVVPRAPGQGSGPLAGVR